MAKALFLIVLIYVLYTLFKRYTKNLTQNNQSTKSQQQSPGEKMVQCPICKTHVPASETTTLNQQLVCKNQPCNK